MATQAFPPQRSLAAKPVSSDDALKMLQSYLASIPQSPYLLPNARLDVHGPSAQASSSSVVLHNLQRVEAGLRGEWLAPVLELDDSEVNTDAETPKKRKKRAPEPAAEEWQDLEEYQREQTIEEGGGQEIDAMEVDTNEVEGDETEVPAAQPSKSKAKPLSDKNARKLAKKERHKAAQKEKRSKA